MLPMNFTRREMLGQTGVGMGMLGLAGMLGDQGLLANEVASTSPLAAHPAHFPGKAKHIIHIYLNGGPSQVDTFDPKPMLTKLSGQPLPTGNLTTERHTGTLMGSPFKFAKHGGVGDLWHGDRESESAGLYRDVPGAAGGGCVKLAGGVLAGDLSGNASRYAED